MHGSDAPQPALTDSIAERSRVAEAPAPDVQPGIHHRLQARPTSQQIGPLDPQGKGQLSRCSSGPSTSRAGASQGALRGPGYTICTTTSPRFSQHGSAAQDIRPCLSGCLPAEVLPIRVQQAEGEGGALALSPEQGLGGQEASGRQETPPKGRLQRRHHAGANPGVPAQSPGPAQPSRQPGAVPLPTCLAVHGRRIFPASERRWSGTADWPADREQQTCTLGSMRYEPGQKPRGTGSQASSGQNCLYTSSL